VFTKVRGWRVTVLALLTIALLGLPVAAGAADVANGITSPTDGAKVSGSVDVKGYAADPNFMKWQLDLLPGGDEAAATFVALGETAGDFSYKLDTTAYPNGEHVLRLRVVTNDGNYKEFIKKVTVANVVAGAAAAPAQAAVGSPEANKAAARKWFTAWEQGDAKAMGELLATNFVNHSPPLPADRDGFIAAGVENYEQFPTGKYTIQNVIAEGDLVSTYGNFQGAHTGKPFMGIPATGAKANFDFSIVFRMKDGKITDRWGVSDSVMGMLVPLGFKLTPPG